MFRAISCLCLPASSARLPPPSKATIAALLPSPPTPLRLTGIASIATRNLREPNHKHNFSLQGVRWRLSEGAELPLGGGQDWRDLSRLWRLRHNHPHCRPHCLHPGRGGRADGFLHHQHQGDKVVNLKHFLLCQKVGGSAEEVARVVAACRECDTTGAWSQQPRGTPVSHFKDCNLQINFLNCVLFRPPGCLAMPSRLTFPPLKSAPTMRRSLMFPLPRWTPTMRRRRTRRRRRPPWTTCSLVTPSATSVLTDSVFGHICDSTVFLNCVCLMAHEI